MLHLLSPAKAMDCFPHGNDIPHSIPQFLTDSEVLVKQLQQYSVADIKKLMKLSDKLAELNRERFHSWQPALTLKNAKQALLMFNGDVYKSLNLRKFSKDDFLFAQDHLRILSGLYGVLKPLDLIQAYRLEMGTRLNNVRGRDLYFFWKEIVTSSLIEAIKESGSASLVNLASNEYYKVVDSRQLSEKCEIITPIFKDYKNGEFKVISFFAKKARGMMSAFIIQNRNNQVEELKRFTDSGYRFNDQLSKGRRWVFSRKGRL